MRFIYPCGIYYDVVSKSLDIKKMYETKHTDIVHLSGINSCDGCYPINPRSETDMKTVQSETKN